MRDFYYYSTISLFHVVYKFKKYVFYHSFEIRGIYKDPIQDPIRRRKLIFEGKKKFHVCIVKIWAFKLTMDQTQKGRQTRAQKAQRQM